MVENATLQSIDPNVSFTINKNCVASGDHISVLGYEDVGAHTVRAGGCALAALGDDAASWGEIAYVVFKAIAWTCEPTRNPPGPANLRFTYAVEEEPGSALVDPLYPPPWLLADDEDGLDPGDNVNASYVLTSVPSTTKPGGGAWTIAALAALTDLYLAFDTTAEKYAAEMDVGELWVEVYGKIGVEPSKIRVRQRIGQPIRKRVVSATSG